MTLAAGFPTRFAAIAVGAGARAVRARRRDPRTSIAAGPLVAVMVPLGASRAAGAAAFALLVLAFAAYLHYWNLLGYRL